MIKTEKYYFDVVVIGAGIIGIATSLEHAKKGLQVLLVEKNPTFGQGVSSRNSEVIHAGIYYPQNSLKAQFCRRGMELLYNYCKIKMIPHRQIGKLIIQTDDNETSKLQEIYTNGLANGCTELRIINNKDLRNFEPEVKGINAIWSPKTGIIDSHACMSAMLADLEKEGGTVVFNHLFERIVPTDDAIDCLVDNSVVISTKKLINSAGLGSTSLAKSIEGFQKSHVENISFCKGSYFGYEGSLPFSHLIYPLPNNEGLGIHFTLDMNWNGKFGPDTEWVGKEDYSLNEKRTPHAFKEIKKYWPKCDHSLLRPIYAGIRPKLGTKEHFRKDFMIQTAKKHNIPGLINLFGMESPGLTSALSIAEHIANHNVCSSD